MTFTLPGYVQNIIDRLQAGGFEAYAVGGCVRDMLRGVTPGDYDIATSALPCQVKALFEKTADTGIKHGTVTVISEKGTCEVTTFRTESDYGDMRHPQRVDFVSDIKEDLMRRDFTVNAMAYNSRCGLIDLFGGEKDLNARILRTVGDPDERFCEDALRILRLFRFASVLDFSVEKRTLESALKLLPRLQKVSRERIAAELKKAVQGQNIAAFSPLIAAGGLNFLMISRDRLENISRLPGGTVRLFAFINLCSTSRRATCDALKLSNKEKDYIEKMFELTAFPPADNAEDIKHALRTGGAVFGDFLDYCAVICGRDTAKTKQIYDNITKRKEPFLPEHLAVNGNDLIKLGYSGEEIGFILDFLLERVIEEPRLNTKEKLLQIARK